MSNSGILGYLAKKKLLLADIQLVHLFVIGASQAGGFNASPSRTLNNNDVLTLTDGPLDANVTTGVFVPLSGGDTYDNDAVPQTYTNVETSVLAAGHQLRALAGPNVRVCGTIHYRGGTTLQDLSQGGAQSAFGYDDLTAAVARVHTLAVANGWSYTPYMIIESSGITAQNPYNTALQNLISQVRAFVTPTYFSGTLQVCMTQPRIAGTPDLGIQVEEVAQADANAVTNYPRRDALLTSEILPDNIHPTNFGQGRMGVYTAYAAFDDLFGAGYTPLTLTPFNSLVPGTNQLLVPTLGSDGALQGTGDFNIQVFDTTNSVELTGNWTVDIGNLRFDITSTPPRGAVNIEFRAGQGTGSLTDSRSNADVIVNAADSLPYTVVKPLIRANYNTNITFPDFALQNTYRLNFHPQQTKVVAGWTSISGFGFTFTDSNTYTIDGTRELFIPASGWLPGGTNGQTTGDDSGVFPDAVLEDQFAGSGTVPPNNNWIELRGLTTDRYYDIGVMLSRQAGGNANRTHNVTFAGLTTQNVNGFNASDNTANLASATKIQPDALGTIRITDDIVGDTFWRINAVEIQEFTLQ